MRVRNGRGQLLDLGPSDARSYSDPRRSDREVSDLAHLRHLRTYGITPDDYAEMLARQGGVCAICRQPETRASRRSRRPGRLSVDHDHQTGRVRGLLCHKCNMLIGNFGDSPARAQWFADHMAEYFDAMEKKAA